MKKTLENFLIRDGSKNIVPTKVTIYPEDSTPWNATVVGKNHEGLLVKSAGRGSLITVSPDVLAKLAP